MLAEMEASMRWGDPIPLIFVSVWLRRLRRAACPDAGRRCNWAWGQHGYCVDAAFSSNGQCCARQDGWTQDEDDRGPHRGWLLHRIKEKDFTLRGCGGERGLKVDDRSV